jgi:small redox-active disulfide protein 2
MLSIKVLGSGCANCKRVEQITRKVIDQLGVEAEIEKITDPSKFADYGVLSTPGLVINEKTVSAGRIPSFADVTSLISSALDSN